MILLAGLLLFLLLIGLVVFSVVVVSSPVFGVLLIIIPCSGIPFFPLSNPLEILFKYVLRFILF